MEYHKFRTGLTFKDVRRMLSQEATAATAQGRMLFVTRNTVLGRWRQIKLDLYDQYLLSTVDREQEYGSA